MPDSRLEIRDGKGMVPVAASHGRHWPRLIPTLFSAVMERLARHHQSTSLPSVSFRLHEADGDWPTQALLVGFDFFFLCFRREKGAIRSLSLQLELSASPAQSTLDWSAQMVSPRLPTVLRGSEIAGTHHEMMYTCAGVLEIKGLWIQIETSWLKTTKHFHDCFLF